MFFLLPLGSQRGNCRWKMHITGSPAGSGGGGLRIFCARLEQHRMTEWSRLKGTTGSHSVPSPCSGIPWSHLGLCPYGFAASLGKENPQPRTRTRQGTCCRYSQTFSSCNSSHVLSKFLSFLLQLFCHVIRELLEAWWYKRTLAPVDESTFTIQTGRVWMCWAHLLLALFAPKCKVYKAWEFGREAEPTPALLTSIISSGVLSEALTE